MAAEQTKDGILEGRVFKFGDDISTDFIAPSRYTHLRKDMPEFAKHCLEDADPTFVQRVRPGDFVVGGKNFGMGSSREHAPIIMKMNGVSAVIAKSFARIFFRNAVNVGLPALICNTDLINADDRLRVDLSRGLIVNETTGQGIEFTPLPPTMLSILGEGGIKPFIRKYGSLDALAT